MSENQIEYIRYDDDFDVKPARKSSSSVLLLAAGLVILAIGTFGALQIFQDRLDQEIASGGGSISISTGTQALPVAQPTTDSSGNGTVIASFDDPNQTAESSLTPPDMSGVMLSRSSNRWGYEALAALNKWHPDRQVNIRTPVAFALTGVTANEVPNEVQIGAMVTKLAREECAALTSILAETCALASVNWQMDEDERTVWLRMFLDFTQKQEFGTRRQGSDIYGEESKRLESQTRTLLSGGRDAAPSQRRKFYEDAERECAAKRNRYGNCALQGLRVSSRLQEGRAQTTARATLGWISNQPTR
jgi:hypothetical protein